MHVRVWVCTLECNAQEGQRRASEPLGLKLKVVVNYLIWVPGTELKSTARTCS